MNRIAVYGTLRRGGFNHEYIRLNKDAKFIEQTTVPGKLWKHGWAPVAELTDDGSRIVVDVFDVDDKLLEKLDLLEMGGWWPRQQVEGLWVWYGTPGTWDDPWQIKRRVLVESGDWSEYFNAF